MTLPQTSQRRSFKLLGVALTMTVLAACSNMGTSPELEAATYRSSEAKFVALKDDNKLVLFNGEQRRRNYFVVRKVRGVEGELLGIDYRPANGKLYGLTSADKLYTINVSTGQATFVSELNDGMGNAVEFGGGVRSGLDFNPAVDRLRLTGTNDQNYRVNVDTGATLIDGLLAYAKGDRNEGKNPSVTGSAYTNSFKGAMPPTPPAMPTLSTTLYGIDYRLDVLVIQNPPNDGTLNTVGSLKADFGREVGFDIVAEGSKGGTYNNTAYAVTNSRLYKIDLEDGEAYKVKHLPRGDYRGLAVMLGGGYR